MFIKRHVHVLAVCRSCGPQQIHALGSLDEFDDYLRYARQRMGEERSINITNTAAHYVAWDQSQTDESIHSKFITYIDCDIEDINECKKVLDGEFKNGGDGAIVDLAFVVSMGPEGVHVEPVSPETMDRLKNGTLKMEDLPAYTDRPDDEPIEPKAFKRPRSLW